MDLPFDFKEERTMFSDDTYSAIGRALAFATCFESNCKSFLYLIHVCTAMQNADSRSSLNGDEWIAKAEEEISRRTKTLGRQIEAVLQHYHLPSDISSVIHKGRKARNIISHEVTLDVEHIIESDKGREKILKDIEVNVRDIAEANRIICLMIHMETKEPLPSYECFKSYCDRVAQWVCAVEP